MGRKWVENILIFFDNLFYQKLCKALNNKGFKQKTH